MTDDLRDDMDIKGKHLYIIHEMAEWHDPLRIWTK